MKDYLMLKEKLLKTSINQRIFGICLICISWILLYKLLFLDIGSIFPKAYEIGEITFNMFCSVIASGIFYYIVVYLENKRVAKILYPTINDRLKTFGVGVFLIVNDLYDLKGQKYSDKIPEMEDFCLICDGIVLTSKPPIIRGNPSYEFDNWFEYFNYFFNSDKYISNLLYSHSSYLTPEILKELDALQYSVFQRSLDVYRLNKRCNTLAGNSRPFWLYLKTLEKLSEMQLN